ncbi:MAG: tRNA (adenosine(37)-N6)-threonylcarbamoyltransferase complex ATPase subunit type 1 TsaE [Proteobacteria bacterium]|nr:tRNA (adenosine(37)-N6)-threonylcarbamoyltransferase complex ATPase subunit type 1 TsaE [Pseudomonadota bacterium]
MYRKEIATHAPEETARLAAELSLWARPGMVLLLQGDLGAGKSTFARAFIQALAERSDFDVPSPTFTLVQSYDETRIPVFHADLYRLNTAAEIHELGLADLLTAQAGLIEWADKLPAPLTENALSVHLAGKGSERLITLVAEGAWATALRRNDSINAFLDGGPARGAIRHFLEGDASFRRYEWLATPDGRKPILMDMPQRPDGPPVKDGKPYSAIAHLAEGLPAVVAVNSVLTARGYSAPLLHHFDLAQGLALIENLGARVYGRMVLAGEDMHTPLLAAAELLADMARHDWPATVALPNGTSHEVRPYDEEALLIEADLLPSWFWPYRHGTDVSGDLKASFAAVWRRLLPHTQQPRPQWVMRDFHSPNLIWIPDRDGIKRVGLIDTQDAVMGHGAYDLVSMTQDARVDLPDDLVEAVIGHYLALRRKADAGFDADRFRASYAVLGAQRATKILGIFARLSKRDGKHGYLRHMPRVSRALARNLEHPVLAELRDWYRTHLPDALTVQA